MRRHEALPAVLAMLVPGLFVISAMLDGCGSYAVMAGGWLVSIVLAVEVLPLDNECD